MGPVGLLLRLLLLLQQSLLPLSPCRGRGRGVESAAHVKSLAPPPAVTGVVSMVGEAASGATAAGEGMEEPVEERGVQGVIAPSQTRPWQCARRPYSAYREW